MPDTKDQTLQQLATLERMFDVAEKNRALAPGDLSWALGEQARLDLD